jgi:hypothetical protein
VIEHKVEKMLHGDSNKEKINKHDQFSRTLEHNQETKPKNQ